MKRISTTYIIMLLMLLPMVAVSCGSEEPGGDDVRSGKESEVTFTISTRAPGEETEQPTTDNELMKSWRVIFVKGDVVKYVVSKDAVEDANKERDTFTIAMQTGAYDIYAFANLEALGDTGNAIANMKAGEAANFPAVSLNAIYTDEDQLIPMSRHLRHEVKANDEKGTDIELIRMLGKVEFEFSNASGSPLTVTGVTFGQLYGGPATLFPQFASTGELAAAGTDIVLPSDFTDNSVTTGECSFGEGVSLEANADSKVYKHFYVHETSALSHPTGQFYLSVKLKRGGEQGETEEQRYALAGGSGGSLLTAIRRNDYIQIPLKLTEYRVELDVLSYAPIAGYPTDMTTDGKNEFYVKFFTPGKFKLKPSVTDVSTGEKVPFEVTLTVTDTDGILKGTTEKITNDAGELIGHLQNDADGNAKYGTAEITAEFKVTRNNSAERIFTRRIFIIRSAGQ